MARGHREPRGDERREIDEEVRRAARAAPHLGAAALYRSLREEVRAVTGLERVRRLWHEAHGRREAVPVVDPVAGPLLVAVRGAAAGAVERYGPGAVVVVAIGGVAGREPVRRLLHGGRGIDGRVVGRTGTRWLVAWPARWLLELEDKERVRRDVVVEVVEG